MPLGVKSLIIDVLQRTVGEFIVGLDQDNLKVGVTSGEIVLTDLELNTAALARFHLPVDVRSARVESLRVEIPWVALSSKPVRIEILGVYAVVATIQFALSVPLVECSSQLVHTLLQPLLAQAALALRRSLLPSWFSNGRMRQNAARAG